MTQSLLFLGIATGSLTVPPDTDCPREAFAAEVVVIENLVREYARPDVPGIALAVIHRGELVFAQGFGLANLEEEIRADCTTNFRLASLTKAFTAMGIAILEREGRLSLTDPVGSILPDIPEWAKLVRIGHLLVHTSGLPQYEDLIPDTQEAQLVDRDVPVILRSASGLLFEPGSRYEYSNSGYALLALIIESVSGRSFADFLKERIFEPVGMAGTVAHQEGISTVVNRAFGYQKVADGFVRSDQSLTSAVLGDGGIYTSIHDLVKWDAALSTPEFSLSQDRLAPFAATVEDGTTYGFGWFVDAYRGRVRHRHNGSTVGFRNEIHRYPEDDLTIIVLSNRSVRWSEPLVETIADLYLGGHDRF